MTNRSTTTHDIDRFSIVGRHKYDISNASRDEIHQLSNQLLADEPALMETEVFGAKVSAGVGPGVALHISNNYDITLLEEHSISGLEYRMSLLAREGDIFLVRGGQNKSFDRYRSEYLSVGTLNVVEIPDSKPGVPISVDTNSQQFKTILSAVRSAVKSGECLTLVPYIGMDSIWLLASALAREVKTEVRVAAPPPRLTRRVNDKLWFADRVVQVLGEQSVPPVRRAYGPAAMTGLVQDFANKFDQVVVKVTDSAGSFGNVKLASADLLRLSTEVVQSRLLSELHSRGWHDQFPLMVEVWDSAVLSSPSIQIWIPEPLAGAPIVEGIFDQSISTDNDRFVGATVACMPEQWEHRLVDESTQLAYLLQRLGYFGRVSFDTVIAGNNYDDAQLHWIECNGRWGGVSIPMTLLNRLLGDYRNKQFIIVQNAHTGGVVTPFEQVVTCLRDLLFKQGINQSGIVLPVPDSGQSNILTSYIAIADDLNDAEKLVYDVDRRICQVRH